jgi:cysteinyl-tRNA synthetase
MSKSLGNFFTVREILARYRPEEIRYFILTSHYRSPLNYDEEHLQNARAALTRFYTTLRGLPAAERPAGEDFEVRFRAAMDDDFNTPEALAVLFDLVREINRVRETDAERAAALAAELRHLGEVLGVLQDDPESFLRSAAGSPEGLGDEQIEQLIGQRVQARKERNWAEADRIRAQLQEAGILLEDGPQGTSWRRSG